MTQGLVRLASVAFAVTSDSDLQFALDDSRSRQDDAFWAAYIRAPYTPQRFLTWWVARRWVVPRDIRKE